MRIINNSEREEILKSISNDYKVSEDALYKVSAALVSESIKNDSEQFIILCGENSMSQVAIETAKFLSNMNKSVTIFSFNFKVDQALLEKFDIKCYEMRNEQSFLSYLDQIDQDFSLIDAMYDYKVSLPLSDSDYEFIKILNQKKYHIISLDVPSGLCGETGLISSAALKADKTISLFAPAQGLYINQGLIHSGEIVNLSQHLPQSIKLGGQKKLVTQSEIQASVISRNELSEKKNYGHSLILGGSHGRVGSILLASSAALKLGTGVVTAVTWESEYSELSSRLIPELRSGYIPLDDSKWDKLTNNFEIYNSIVIGPGLGVSARSRRAVLKVISNFSGPIIIDADAINILKMSEDKNLFRNRKNPTIFTPDKTELSKLISKPIQYIEENPLESIKEVVEAFNAFVLLKGACSYFASPSGEVFFHYLPNSGMATGGVGDVLSGILGGILAQDSELKMRNSLINKIFSLESSVILGLSLHSKAGLFAADTYGVRAMTAMSIVENLPKAFDSLEVGV